MVVPGHICLRVCCKLLLDQGRSGRLSLCGLVDRNLDIPPHHNISRGVVHFLSLWLSILGPICKRLSETDLAMLVFPMAKIVHLWHASAAC